MLIYAAQEAAAPFIGFEELQGSIEGLSQQARGARAPLPARNSKSTPQRPAASAPQPPEASSPIPAKSSVKSVSSAAKRIKRP